MEKLNFGYSLKNIPTPDKKKVRTKDNNRKAIEDHKPGFNCGLKSGRSPP